MRFTNVVLVLGFGCVSALSVMAAGCGGGGETGSGGAGGGSSTSVSTSTSTSASVSTSVSSGSAAGSCAPTDAACTKVQSDCVALVDNKEQAKFSLRMAHLGVEKPAALASPLVKTFVENGVGLNLAKCNVNGGGTFNLLMQFDTTAKTLTVGGAKPVTDPTKGYSFVTTTVGGNDIKPVTVDVTIGADGVFTQAKGIDIVLPIYLSPTAMEPAVLLPIQQAKLSGTLTDSNNCIGKFDPSQLTPKVCTGGKPYTDAADLDGHITLEQADTVILKDLGNQSLCVLLSGDPTTYGDGAMPNKCKRTADKINFQGDWCNATNDTACADSVKLTGKLAASAVLVP